MIDFDTDLAGEAVKLLCLPPRMGGVGLRLLVGGGGLRLLGYSLGGDLERLSLSESGVEDRPGGDTLRRL